MVQLSPSPNLDVTPPEHLKDGEDRRRDLVVADGPNGGSPLGLSTQQLGMDTSTVYYGYDLYIEDGLICLKNKVRNLEKKKLKLEDYKRRLTWGEELNHDQMAAAEKYEEVLHHLAFAQELHKTLDELTQNLLRAQRKAVRKDKVAKVDTERRNLTSVLQFQHLLHSMQLEHIRTDLLAGRNQAPLITAQQLQSLSQLATLLGVKRDHTLSLEEQMERAAVAHLDLLEGKDKPVAGSTYKLFKEELAELMSCKYFTCLPSPPIKPAEESLRAHSPIATSNPKDVSKENWKGGFQTRERVPPDCWDQDSSVGPCPPPAAVHRPWKGAASFIPKGSVTTKKQSAGCKPRKRRAKGVRPANSAVYMDMPLELFNSTYALPKDPFLRKQHLEDLVTKIHGSFSFMQDSLLEGEISPINVHQKLKQRSSKSPSPLGHADLGSPVDVLPKEMHSTPLPPRLIERRASKTNGDQCLETSALKVPSLDLPHEPPRQLAEIKGFPSPPLYRREATIPVSLEKSCAYTPESKKHPPCSRVESCTVNLPQGRTFSTPPSRRTLTSSQFQNIQQVFKVNATFSQNGEFKYKPDSSVFAEPRYSIASTQTPAEFFPPEDEIQPGGSYIPQTHLRDCGPTFYSARDAGYHHGHRCGGGNLSAAWSDSSQVSTPDREGAFTIVDSGQGDSLSVSTMEVPLSPHGDHQALLPMQLYPLSQPLRVAFNASRTANFAPGNLDQPIAFDQLHSNLGEMFDTSMGRFTSPVNGTYVFLFHILKLAINVPLYINLMRNEEVMVSAYANDGAPDHETASNHAILPLFQGDQVWLRLHRGAIYGSTWKYSTFSGFLLYQDST
ncbi:hypothetical protein CgunFtcFv8_009248 [Champsocephalus gunnari]|uniref:C1q domain-containing protein n=1 Tax=Champsocephalus gunnari TaxID=52237 RepID=A0AAN8C2E4_CHAGU|nr:hypothetical protein CgunFtcFv8_009248 [Champsocephalus gunnari]